MNDDVLTGYITDQYETTVKDARRAVKLWRHDNPAAQVADIEKIAEDIWENRDYWENRPE